MSRLIFILIIDHSLINALLCFQLLLLSFFLILLANFNAPETQENDSLHALRELRSNSLVQVQRALVKCQSGKTDNQSLDFKIFVHGADVFEDETEDVIKLSTANQILGCGVLVV